MTKYYLHKLNDSDKSFIQNYAPNLFNNNTNSVGFCLIDATGRPYLSKIENSDELYLPIYITQIVPRKVSKYANDIAQILEANIFFKLYSELFQISYWNYSSFDLLSKSLMNNTVNLDFHFAIIPLHKLHKNLCCNKSMLDAIFQQAIELSTIFTNINSLENTIIQNIQSAIKANQNNNVELVQIEEDYDLNTGEIYE